MRYHEYSDYKDSGVDWLNKVPKHWELKRLGSKFTQRKEKVSDKDFEPLSVTKNGILPQLANVAKSDASDNRKLVRKGDFVINSRSDRKGSSGLSDFDGSVSLINIVLEPNNTIDSNFCHHLLRSYLFQEEFYKYGHGIVADLWTTNYDDMKNIYLAIPSMDEQQKIATFVNREISKIDNLISKQEQLIKLLEEQRKSIISHAVTKGLNPNAAMKDSGIEWLGEIPAHWDVKPIKSLYSRVKKTGFENETLLSVYREYGVIVKSSRDDNHNKESDDLSPYQLVNVGDLVINKMKAWQGSLAISEHRGIVSPAYYIYEPFESHELNNKFIHNQIRSQYFIQSYKNYSKGIRVGQWDLESDLFVRINLYIPPADEQNEIVNYIQSETNKINNLIDKQKLLIEKLQEYRSSIISHAVTGKIDVREAL